YQALERALRGALGLVDYDHRYNVVQLLCSVYRTAHDKKVPGVVEDLRAFAGKEVPELLKYQTSHYANVVSTVSQTLHDLAGVREGLAFLISRLEQEPGWFRFNNQDAWSQHSGTIADWRQHVKNMGDLEERLFKIVAAELRRDLETRQARARPMYHKQNAYFWAEKADAFAKVAEEVWAKHQRSGAAVRYIAEYLFVGLEQHNRAIEMLFLAHNQKLLDEPAQWQLVNYLHQTNRHGEIIALLVPLIKHSPTNLEYRTMLMHAYFRTNRPTELRALLKETDEFFHKDGRWTESTLAGLAHSCLENRLFTESVAYYVELIALYQRNRPGRGIGD